LGGLGTSGSNGAKNAALSKVAVVGRRAPTNQISRQLFPLRHSGSTVWTAEVKVHALLMDCHAGDDTERIGCYAT